MVENVDKIPGGGKMVPNSKGNGTFAERILTNRRNEGMKSKHVVLGLALAVALVLTPVGNLFASQVSASGNNTQTGSGNNTDTDGSGGTDTEAGGTDTGSGSAYQGSELGSFTIAGGQVVTSTIAGANASADVKNVAVVTPKASINAAAGLNADRLAAGESIYLTVEKSLCGEKARQAVTDAASSINAKVATILEIDLNILNKQGIKQGKVSELSAPVEMVLSTPEGFDGKTYDFAVIRIHDGKTDILPDMDTNPDTITFATDRFSVYAISYGAKGSFDAFKASAKGVKDSVPKTGEASVAVLPFLAAGMAFAAAALVIRKKREI